MEAVGEGKKTHMITFNSLLQEGEGMGYKS